MPEYVKLSKMKNLSELQEFNVKTFKNHPQFIFEDVPYLNSKIYDQSLSITHYLKSLDLKPKSKIAVCGKLTPQAFATFPAIWRADHIAVSVHAKLAPPQIVEILMITKCELLFIDADKWAQVKAALGNDFKVRVVLLSGDDDTLTSLSDIKPNNKAVTSKSNRSDTSVIMFSSGSTGRPKGIVLTHGSMLSMVEQTVQFKEKLKDNYMAPLSEGIRLIFNTPLGHVVGLTGVTLNLATGSTLVLQDAFEPDEMLRLIEKYKTEGYYFGPPTVFIALMAHKASKKFDLSSMKYWMCGGAPMGVEKFNQFTSLFPGKICFGYGMTEVSGYAAYGLVDDKYPNFSVGKLFPQVEVSIVGENGKEVPVGDNGELRMRGPNVVPGYYELPEETQKVFRDGWLYSGDMAKIDEEGNLYIVGRVKHLIRQAGVNIYPRTIELVLESIREVKECAVVGMADEVLGERVVAYLVSNENVKLSIDDIRKICIEKLARHEVPRQFFVVDKLPRTSSNKIDLQTLMKGYGPASTEKPEKASLSQSDYLDQRNHLMTTMRKISERMGHTNIGDDSPLMQSGFDSLGCVEFALNLSEELKTPLKETLVFNFSTFQQIADHLLPPPEIKIEFPKTEAPPPAADFADVAIIGISCRLPGGIINMEEMWDRLRRQVDCTSEIPEERWNAKEILGTTVPLREGESSQTRGGMMDNPGLHDAVFFGLTPLEAKTMDPQARLVQQMAWEAIESSLIDPKELKKSTTGVYVGTLSYDFLHLAYQSGRTRPEVGIGASPGLLPGRLSNILDLNGPSIFIDTTCSTSLTAIHLAQQGILSGDCDLALAGGINLLLVPFFSQIISMLGALSPDGRCYSFDSNANGYARSEGGGIVLLKRLDQAVRDKNKILGVLKGTALYHDGRSSNVGAPNGTAQIATMSRALKRSKLNPDEITYVEAHGTGTKLGDAIELNAINEAYRASNEQRANPLYVGSVKSNIGHTEGGAGVAGLLKVLTSFKHSRIPATINYRNANTKFDWKSSRITVADFPVPWNGKKIAAINSYGFNGSIASAIVAEPPVAQVQSEKPKFDRTHHILCLSAKTLNSLKKVSQKYIDMIDENPHLDLPSICYTANARRKHFNLRVALVFASPSELRRKLSDVQKMKEIKPTQNKHNRIGFLFSGQGGVYPGMSQDLFKTNPTFKLAVKNCEAVFAPKIDKTFSEIVSASKESRIVFDVRYGQAASTSLQVGLVEMYKRWGLIPTHILGHSGGEFAAAFAAGLLDQKTAIDLAIERSLYFHELPKSHQLAAVWDSWENIATIKNDYKLAYEFAADNAPNLITIVSTKEDLAVTVEIFKEKGIRIKVLDNAADGFGGHSSWVNPMLKKFEKYCHGLTYEKSQAKYFSSLLGRQISSEKEMNDSYWVKLTKEPVKYREAFEGLIDDEVSFFIEVGPSTTLSSIVPLNAKGKNPLFHNSLKEGEADWSTILTVLKSAYENGIEINWEAFDSDYNRETTDIPLYQFDLLDFGIDGGFRGQQGATAKKPVSVSSSPVEEKAVPAVMVQPQIVAVKEQNQHSDSDMIEVFAEIIGVPSANFDSRKSFKEHSLDSLKFMQMILDVEEKLSVKVDLATLNFSADSTFVDLMSVLRQLQGQQSVKVEAPVIVPLRPNATTVPAVESPKVVEIPDCAPVVISLLAEMKSVPVSEVDPRSTLRELEMDSLKFVQVVLDLEERLSMKIDLMSLTLSGDSALQELIDRVNGMAGKGSISGKLKSVSSIQSNDLKIWAPKLKEDDKYEYQLFCFHHMGGAASLYNEWFRLMDPRIQVIPIQLPGREERLSEPQYEDIAKTLTDLLPVITKAIRKPFSLFGHSLGAGLAAQLAQKLSAQGVMADRLFISALRAPSTIKDLNMISPRLTPQNIEHYVEMSKELLKNEEFVKRLIPKYDVERPYSLTVFESLRNFKIDMSISAFAGESDRIATPEMVKQWEEVNRGFDFEFKKYSGGHMFLMDHSKEITALINSYVDAILKRKLAKSG